MRKIIGFCIGLLVISNGVGWSQKDTCLTLWQFSPLKPNNVAWSNPDSVMVDICHGTAHSLAEFAKNRFIISFLYYIIPDSLAPIGDSLERDWRDIGAAYSTIRNVFDSIEHQLGAFTLQHVTNSPDTLRDTLQPGNKQWSINFKNYTNIDTALHYIKQLPEINPNLGVTFDGRPTFFESVSKEITRPLIKIWPQPCSSDLFVQGEVPLDKILVYDPLGRQVAIPIRVVSDSLISADVAKMLEGVYFFYISGQFFKILIQK